MAGIPKYFGWTLTKANADLDKLAHCIPTGRTVATLALYLLNNAIFDVKDGFNGLPGAKGDSVGGVGTDDTVAINATITACAAAGGGFVRLPASEYLTTAAIILKPRVNLVGDGVVQSRIRLSAAAVAGTHVLQAIEVAYTNYYSSIRDLGVVGNWDGVTPGQVGDGIHTEYVYRLELWNVSAVQTKRHGVYEKQGGYNSIYGNQSIINACGLNCLKLDTCTTTSVQNVAMNSAPFGNVIDVVDQTTLTIDTCKIDGSAGGWLKVGGVNNRNIRVTNNHVEGQTGPTVIDLLGSSGYQFHSQANYYTSPGATVCAIRNSTAWTGKTSIGDNIQHAVPFDTRTGWTIINKDEWTTDSVVAATAGTRANRLPANQLAVPTAVATTILTLPLVAGLYTVYACVETDVANYSSVALIAIDTVGAPTQKLLRVDNANGALMVLTLAAARAVQVTQSSGGPQKVNHAYAFLPTL